MLISVETRLCKAKKSHRPTTHIEYLQYMFISYLALNLMYNIKPDRSH